MWPGARGHAVPSPVACWPCVAPPALPGASPSVGQAPRAGGLRLSPWLEGLQRAGLGRMCWRRCRAITITLNDVLEAPLGHEWCRGGCPAVACAGLCMDAIRGRSTAGRAAGRPSLVCARAQGSLHVRTRALPHPARARCCHRHGRSGAACVGLVRRSRSAHLTGVLHARDSYDAPGAPT